VEDDAGLSRRELLAAGSAIAAAAVVGDAATAPDATAASGARPTPTGFSGRPTRQRASSVPSLEVRPRSAWSAGPAKGETPSWDAFTAIVVHHSGDTRRDPVAAMRIVQTWHQSEGSDDVGYHLFIDRQGVIWQGRDASTVGGADGSRQLQGAHAKHWNVGTLGVCLLGDLTRQQPTKAMMSSLTRVVAWRCGLAGVDPRGTVRAADGRDLPVVMTHRTVGSTRCPGNSVASMLDGVRDQARSMLGISGPVTSSSGGSQQDTAVAAASTTDAGGALKSVGGWRAWGTGELVTIRGRWDLKSTPAYVSIKRIRIDGTGVMDDANGKRLRRIRPPAWITGASPVGDDWWIGDATGAIHRWSAATDTWKRSEQLIRPVVGMCTASNGGWWAVTSAGLAAGEGAPRRQIPKRDVPIVGVAAEGDTVAVVWSDGLVIASGASGQTEHRRSAPGGAVGMVRTKTGWAAVGRGDTAIDGHQLPRGLITVVT
jgi:hypothetical protein